VSYHQRQWSLWTLGGIPFINSCVEINCWRTKYQNLIIPGFIFGAIWCLNLVISLFLLRKGSEIPAKLGDSFGPTNALFSSLAAAFALYAVILSQRQMAQTKAAEDHSRKRDDTVALIQAHSIVATLSLQQSEILKGKLNLLKEESNKLTGDGLRALNPGSYAAIRYGQIAEEGQNVEIERLRLIKEAHEGRATIDRLLSTLSQRDQTPPDA
jgi:hypothetical protein